MRFRLDREAGLDLALLALLAATLRFYNLNRQLWSDEIVALVFTFRSAFSDYASSNPSFVPHPLYELMAFTSISVFGEQPWTVRLPAALFGVGTVLMVYLFVRKVAGRGEALLAGGLMSVFYNHVFYSQDARGYSTMLFFFTLSSLMLLDLDRLKGWQSVVFVISSALGCLAVVFGAFALAGHSMVLLAVVWWRRRGRDRSAMSLGAAGALVAAAAVVTLAAYLPWLEDITRVATQASSQIEAGQRMQPALLPELLEGLRTALGGASVLIVGVMVGLVGTVSYLRRDPFAAAVLLLPVVLNVAVLVILGAAVHPRFVLLALPVGIVLGARGLAVMCATLRAVWIRAGLRDPRWVGVAASLLVLAFAAYPLARYYRLPKQDFQGALRITDRLADPEDQVVGVTVAGNTIRAYYRPGFDTVQNVEDLRRLENGGDGVWVITTIERALQQSDPDLLAHLEDNYRLVGELPGTLDGGEVKVYQGEGDVPEGST